MPAVDLLAALHPVRLPAPPASSPAELLALGAAGGVAGALLLVGALALFARWRSRRTPLREALAAVRAAAHLPPDERASAHARLLRRYAATLAGPHTLRERDDAWLARLDAVFATDFFTQGGGRLYGEALYRRIEGQDIAALDADLAGLLRRGRPQ